MRESLARISEDSYERTAVGYEPTRWDRPPQLRHTLSPATRIVSSTADGSIVSTVVDMTAYARLLLARGDLPDGRGGRIVSERMFSRLADDGFEVGDGTRYAYGLWQEDVEGHRWLGHTGGMVGHTGLLAVSPDEGLGVVALQNGAGALRPVVAYALEAVRSSLGGREPPAVWTPPAPTQIARAEEYVGRYEGDDGRTLEVRAVADGLAITMGPLTVRLERDPLAQEAGDSFLVAHEALDRFPLEFVRDDDGAVVEAFHGSTWFRGEGYPGPEPTELPEGSASIPGLYRNNDPWAPVIRVVARKGSLVLQWPYEVGDEGTAGRLIPMDDGWFAVGAERDPRRIRFLGDADGKAVVAEYNGGRWYRSCEE
jgi:hypothetical protein